MAGWLARRIGGALHKGGAPRGSVYPGQPMERLPPDRLALQGANFSGWLAAPRECGRTLTTAHAGQGPRASRRAGYAHGAAFHKGVLRAPANAPAGAQPNCGLGCGKSRTIALTHNPSGA